MKDSGACSHCIGSIMVRVCYFFYDDKAMGTHIALSQLDAAASEFNGKTECIAHCWTYSHSSHEYMYVLINTMALLRRHLLKSACSLV